MMHFKRFARVNGRQAPSASSATHHASDTRDTRITINLKSCNVTHYNIANKTTTIENLRLDADFSREKREQNHKQR